MTNNKAIALIIAALLVVCAFLAFKVTNLSTEVDTWQVDYNAAEARKDSLQAAMDATALHIADLDAQLDSLAAIGPTYIIKHDTITKQYEKDYSTLDTAGHAYIVQFFASRYDINR